MYILFIVGGLFGVEVMVIKMMKKKIEDLDILLIGEFLEILLVFGIKFWVCKLVMDMFDLEEVDLIEDLDGVFIVGDFYN